MDGDSILAASGASGRKQACLAAGVLILLDAIAARVVLTADEACVYVFGHAIAWECAWRRAGLPCPTCGMTRSVVMALHGEIGRAWHVAPGGPVLAAGLLAVAAALLGLPSGAPHGRAGCARAVWFTWRHPCSSGWAAGRRNSPNCGDRARGLASRINFLQCARSHSTVYGRT